MASVYRSHVRDHMVDLLSRIGPVEHALDFGAGDGWLAQELMNANAVGSVTPVDVKARPNTVIEPVLYDGERLPFEDRAFDLVYSVDVIHHSPSPEETLREALRCAGHHFVLKDHTYDRWRTKALISLLDELGNRRFGIRSTYNYQRDWTWLPVIEAEGFERIELHHPIVCDTRPVLSRIVNGFQFIGRWRRAGVGE